jgi:hypothetical protein
MFRMTAKRTRRILGYTEDARNKILGEIIVSGRRGIFQNILLEKLPGLGRTTLFGHSKKLQAEGLIRIIREGKRAKYVATDKASVDIGTAIGNRFITSIFGKGIGMEFVSVNNPEDEGPLSFMPRMNIEDAISELSKQVGVYIIYNFIQSMNLENYIRLLKSQLPNHRIKDLLKEEKGRRMISDMWLRITILSQINRIKHRFRHVLERYGYVPDETTPEGREKYDVLGYYLLDRKAIRELLNALYKSHPEMINLRNI